MQSTKLILPGGLVLIVLMAALSSASPMATKNNDDEEPLQLDGSDGSLFLTGNECGPNERLAVGALPTCEPTCENPRPVCQKVFFTSLDYVPCFCKEPLVRNVKTKQCVERSECPQRTA